MTTTPSPSAPQEVPQWAKDAIKKIMPQVHWTSRRYAENVLSECIARHAQPAAPAVTPGAHNGFPPIPLHDGEGSQVQPAPAQGETPESEAAQREFESGHGYPLAVHVEFAKKQEREITTLREQLAVVEKQRDGWMEDARIRACNTDHANNKLTAATEEVAGMRREIGAIMDACGAMDNTLIIPAIESLRAQLAQHQQWGGKAREAMRAVTTHLTDITGQAFEACDEKLIDMLTALLASFPTDSTHPKQPQEKAP